MASNLNETVIWNSIKRKLPEVKKDGIKQHTVYPAHGGEKKNALSLEAWQFHA